MTGSESGGRGTLTPTLSRRAREWRRIQLNHIANFKTLSPGGYKALGGVHVYLEQSGLSKRLRELVFLRVSQINGCVYCIDMHSRHLLQDGLPLEGLLLVSVTTYSRR